MFGITNFSISIISPPISLSLSFFLSKDDVVMGTLTVRENFAFSARLRLPSSVSERERNERVEQVIYELGLTEVADSKVNYYLQICVVIKSYI